MKKSSRIKRWLYAMIHLGRIEENGESKETSKQSEIIAFYEKMLKDNMIKIDNCNKIIDVIKRSSDEEIDKAMKIVLSRLNKYDRFLYKKIYIEGVSKIRLAIELRVQRKTVCEQVRKLSKKIIEQISDVVGKQGRSQ